MIGKNLKYYRLQNNMTKKKIAEKAGISSMAVTHYESNERMPEPAILKKLAQVLSVSVMDLTASRNENLQFCHGEFRKNSNFGHRKQEYVFASIESYFDRFMTVEDFLGANVLPEPPAIHSLELSENNEINAARLRNWLGLAESGPVCQLVSNLENKGILVCLLDVQESGFSGINGTVENYPYIALNSNMTSERQRFTLAHELTHMAFSGEYDNEKQANAIAGAFLFPETDVIRELGFRRQSIQRDMEISAVEYGISMQCLAYRARECGVIGSAAYESYSRKISYLGWRKNEPSRIESEKPLLFKQLVYRAIEEEEINIQRGAELLQVPFNDIARELSDNTEAVHAVQQ
mgnify:FL=1